MDMSLIMICSVTEFVFQALDFDCFLCDTDSGYAIAEGRPVRERRLGCCGIGCGWCL